ncbi:hypothetical protein Baya_1016 [Bagarius yarrelli]|uniref:Uncharacterized protein n=1 Tax=Bagarius yarrelli TaxID=175774 RepID=A0A556TJW3_BAGYA|nr:hypothetical protein Baya_1016 [Bagarius yarrelli]
MTHFSAAGVCVTGARLEEEIVESPLEQQFACECCKQYSADNSCNQPPFREPQALIRLPSHKDVSNLGKQQHSKEIILGLHAAPVIGQCSCELLKKITRVKQRTPSSCVNSNMAASAISVKLDKTERSSSMF